jgi:phage shock protein E
MLKSIPEIVAVLKETTRLITANDAANEIKSNNGLVIDVREPSECVNESAKGVINIPRGLLEMKILVLEKDPSRPIYLHCASGVRAILSAEQLARIGYENVTVITCPMPILTQTTFDAS